MKGRGAVVGEEQITDTNIGNTVNEEKEKGRESIALGRNTLAFGGPTKIPSSDSITSSPNPFGIVHPLILDRINGAKETSDHSHSLGPVGSGRGYGSCARNYRMGGYDPVSRDNSGSLCGRQLRRLWNRRMVCSANYQHGRLNSWRRHGFGRGPRSRKCWYFSRGGRDHEGRKTPFMPRRSLRAGFRLQPPSCYQSPVLDGAQLPGRLPDQYRPQEAGGRHQRGQSGPARRNRPMPPRRPGGAELLLATNLEGLS